MVQGIKANDYNATWEEAVFDVIDRGELYEIREFNSGMTFFIDKGAFDDIKRRKEGIKTNQRHDRGYKGGGTGDRKTDDGSHEDDDGLQSSKRKWYAGEQIRERLNGDRRIPGEIVKSPDRTRQV